MLGPQRLLGRAGRAQAVVRKAGLEDGDVQLIQATWDKAKTKAGLEGVGVLLFKNIFGTAPEALQLFPFKGENWEKEPGFIKHATDVAGTVDTAVSLLPKMETLGPVLDDLGRKHAGYGVVAGHYPVVGGALLGTLRAALAEEFAGPAEASWGRLWGVITEVMLAGAEKAEPTPEK